jgi:magnesium transporter
MLIEAGSDLEIRAFVGTQTAREVAEMLRDLDAPGWAKVLAVLSLEEQLDVVEELPPGVAADVLEELAPQLSADLLERAPEEFRNQVFQLMELEDQADVLREIDDEDAREDLIEHIPDADLADIAEQQLSDDAVDLVEELPDDRRERVLEEMEADKRAAIEELIHYPDDSAGGLMQTELIRLEPHQTVDEATEHVRQAYARLGEFLDIFVVDAAGRLVGTVRGRQLLINSAEAPLSDFMDPEPRFVPVDMDQELIADIVADYDLGTVPVVDAGHRLLGCIRVDDIVDVIEEEATEDAAKFAGTAPADVHSASILRAIKARLPWLLATFVGGLVILFLILRWEEDLVQEIKLLAAVIPIIIGMAGNVGTQAATVTVRGIAIGEIELARLGRVVAKELVSGVVFAACFGALLYPLIRWVVVPLADLEYPAHLTPTIVILIPAITMALTIITASAVGTLVPLVLHKLGKDPAVASAPFITTTVDVCGIALLVAVKSLLV